MFDEKVEHPAARAFGVEVVQRSLTEGATRAIRDITGQAEHDIMVQRDSLTTLRGDAAEEALQARATLLEPRQAMVVLYENTKKEL